MNRFSNLRRLARKSFGWWNLQRTLVILLVGLMGLFAAVVFSENLAKLVSQGLGIPEKEGSKNEVLKFLGIGMGGLLIAIQAVIANKRANAMDNTASAQVRATAEQANANQLTEQGQRQERLRNAIEHLGHGSASVRMGGAYELFHLARDTQNQDDADEFRQTVLDILCAHIRRTTRRRSYRVKYGSKPSEEVQSLLTLLFMRQHEVFKDHQIDLQGSCLQGANLVEALLREADLAHVNLQGAGLNWADLRCVDLRGAHLQGVDFSEARLQGADLSEARLQGAYLRRASLQGVDLREAHLQAADLAGVHLQGAELEGAFLQGVTSKMAPPPGLHLSDFAKHMLGLIGQSSDLTGVTFEGGLEQEELDALVEGLSDDKAKKLRGQLILHIGVPEINGLPKRHRANTGAYTAEEAKGWIAEYKNAVSEVLEGA